MSEFNIDNENIFKVCYKPNYVDAKFKTFIKTYVKKSSESEDSSQYHVDFILDSLDEHIKLGKNKTLNKRRVNLIHKYIDNGIEYLEF